MNVVVDSNSAISDTTGFVSAKSLFSMLSSIASGMRFVKTYSERVPAVTILVVRDADMVLPATLGFSFDVPTTFTPFMVPAYDLTSDGNLQRSRKFTPAGFIPTSGVMLSIDAVKRLVKDYGHIVHENCFLKVTVYSDGRDNPISISVGRAEDGFAESEVISPELVFGKDSLKARSFT